MEGIERAKLPIADFTKVYKELEWKEWTEQNYLQQTTKGIQGREWKGWADQSYLQQTTQRYKNKIMERMEKAKLPRSDYKR